MADLLTNKDLLIERLASNLPLIRARMKISQAELSEIVGIGRQTLISIENKNSKMRWDTFLAMILVISRNENAAELMSLFGIKFEEVCMMLDDTLNNRKFSPSLQSKLWTDNEYTGDTTIRGFAPLPVGLVGTKCPKCGSANLRGVIIMPSADEQDPNIMCLDCGYWRD